MEYGFVLIVLVLFGARKLGYDWISGETKLKGSMFFFVAAVVMKGLMATMSDPDGVRSFVVLIGIATGLGWLLLIQGAFAITRQPQA